MPEKKPQVSLSMQTGRKPFAPRRRASELEREHGGSLHQSSSKKLTVVNTSWSPQIDVFELGKRLITRVDLPGVKARDIAVAVIGGQLLISGERRQDAEEAQGRFWRSERDSGRFHRTVPLPEGIQADGVSAAFDGGVLEVSLPLPARRAPLITKVPVREMSKAQGAA